MFASADDEGTILLWEYRGLTASTAFQASLMGGYGQTYSDEEAKKAFQDAAAEKEKKAKVTINLLHDRLTLFPAYEPSIREHATATDLEKLKFIFS